jgi:hypothetical protein
MTTMPRWAPVISILIGNELGACRERLRVSEGTQGPLPGVWRIVKVQRDLYDITAGGDFGQSLIILNADGTYTVDKTALFPVSGDGHWSVKTRPGDAGTTVILKPEDGRAAAYQMTYDTIGGEEKIVARFTTVSDNTYRYQLEKVSSPEKDTP